MKEYSLQSSPFDRSRILRLAPDYVEFENGDLKGKEFVRINKAEIVDIKHEMDWIVWYKFAVGRAFRVVFKTQSKQELKITFKSYFGLHRKYFQFYAELVDDIWEYYLSEIVGQYLDQYGRDEQINLLGFLITREGVQLKESKGKLAWSELSIREYHDYFAIYKTAQPEINTRVNFNEWQSDILFSFIKSVLKDLSQKA